MGNCSVESVGWDDSSSDYKIDTQKPFTFNTNELDSVEGWLHKKSKHIGSWRRRYTVLNKDADKELFILKTFKDKEKQINATESILINHNIDILNNTSNTTNEFIIYHKPSKVKYIFKANSIEKRNHWLNILEYHCNDINQYENNNNYIINIIKNNEQINTQSKIEIKNIVSNKLYSQYFNNDSNILQYIQQQKKSDKLRLKLDETKHTLTVTYFDNTKSIEQINSIILIENIFENDEHKIINNKKQKKRDIEFENNKKSYNEYNIQLECNSDDTMLNILITHLKSNTIYSANINNNLHVSNVLQYIEKSKQECTLKIVFNECYKLAQILNLSENYIELILQLSNKNYIIKCKLQKNEEIKSDMKSNANESNEEKDYKYAIYCINNNGGLGLYSSIEGLATRSVFKKHKKDNNLISKNMKKIMREIRNDLPKNLYLSYNNGSMFVRFDESKPRFIQTMLIGLQDTPYFNGCFLFDIYLSNDYPIKPPKIKHITNGANLPTANNGPGGFSPNLHKSTGKVCLSLLGTWNGPGWKANESNVYQILSTLLFMVFGAKHPYYMEPNYGGWEGTVNERVIHDRKVYEYDEELLYYTSKCTILDILKKPYVGFEEVIKVHFKMKREQIIKNMKMVTKCKDYSKVFKNKIKPIYQQIECELNKL